MEGLPFITRGLPHVATENTMISCFSLTYNEIMSILNDLVPHAASSSQALISNLDNLDAAFDNFQKFQPKKFQNNGRSSYDFKATCHYVKHPLIVVPQLVLL